MINLPKSNNFRKSILALKQDETSYKPLMPPFHFQLQTYDLRAKASIGKPDSLQRVNRKNLFLWWMERMELGKPY